MEKFRPYYYDLMVWSTFTFLCAALTLQFVVTLQTALMLGYINIRFEYRPFGIIFHSFSGIGWSEYKILMVYGVGSLVYLLAGRILLAVINVVIPRKVWMRLYYTWLAFMAVHLVPAGMVSGMFIFDGVGVAYKWLFVDIYVRSIIVLGVMVLCVLLRPFWLKVFLRMSFSGAIIEDIALREEYLRWVFVKPFVTGIFLLVPFAVPGGYFAWLISMMALGIVILPLFNPAIPGGEIMLLRSQPPDEINRRRFFRLAGIIIALFVFGFFSIKFLALTD